jgi:hypothetical protein
LKISILTALVLSLCLAATAQTQKTPASQSAAVSAYSPHATIDGCLHLPSKDQFVLQRASGKKYYLGGEIAKLKGLVDKEVRVYGVLTAYEDPTPKMGTSYAESSKEPPEKILIETVSKIDDSCANGSAGPQGAPVVVGSGGK